MITKQATKPLKKSEKAAHSDHSAKVVSSHRLADSSYSAVFPQHADTNHWHGGPRQGHGGSHKVTASLKK